VAETKVLITGASGSGTSTLGRAVAAAIHADFVDADDLFWSPTEPPFQEKRDPVERATLLRRSLSSGQAVVVSGSVMGWDAELEDAFRVIVFLRAPAALRVERLKKRELSRFGRIDEAFIAWAEQYDVGALPGRSLKRQLAWLEQRACTVLHLSGAETVETLLDAVRQALAIDQ
jgi:uridine kinase